MVGPPHGSMLFTPADIATRQASIRRSMFSSSKSGSTAGITIKNVLAPEPSRWTSAVIITTPIKSFLGSLPHSFSVTSINGRKTPISFIMPKNRMANINITATGAMVEMPSTMYPGTAIAWPIAMAASAGIAISAINGESRLLIIATSTPTMVISPAVANTCFTL